MRVVEVPASTWNSRLSGTALEGSLRYFGRDMMRVVGVEDDRGALVGCCGLQTVLHADGAWVHANHRKRGVVAGLLVRAIRDGVRACRTAGVVSIASTPEIERYLDRLGALRIQGVAYAWPVLKDEVSHG